MAISVATYTDLTGLAELKAQARERSPEALRETARQFEALFVQMMLKSMREATMEGGLFDSEQGRLYQEMFDQQISLDLARGRGLGLQDLLVRQLGGEAAGAGRAVWLSMPARGAVPAAAARTAPAPAPSAAQGQPEAGAVAPEDWRPASPAQFARELWPHAERAAARLGVDPEVLIAQAALETGWGQHLLRHADGRPAYNLFNIKAHGGWTGARVAAETTEYRGETAVEERAEFRAYAHPGESFDDYADFIRGNPRYARALQAAPDPGGYLQALQGAGYATDPRYAEKILDILGRGSFRGLVAELKNGPVLPIG